MTLSDRHSLCISSDLIKLYVDQLPDPRYQQQ